MKPKSFRTRVCVCLAALGLLGTLSASNLPNILWIVAEDINPHLGCYGDTNAVTPNLDRLATRGLRYQNCWSTAPVCAPARTTLITGVYPTSTGSEHMRSLVPMPSFMRMYPQLLRERGYYCVNNAKEDYNLRKPEGVWDESSRRAHYKNRPAGKPFFAAFNLESTHESQIRVRPHTLQHDPGKMRLPTYHPDTPEVRRDWAQYYDKITEMDTQAGRILQELEESGLAGETIVFFYGDNGSGMPRSKRWPYKSGLHVPLVIHIPATFQHLAPKDYQPGGATERLVGFVDFAPTLLSLAGVRAPAWMQGGAFLGEFPAPESKYLHGFRGRMDERYDLVRSVRNQRYLYVRNYLPHLIYGQHLEYMFQTPATRVWKDLYDRGMLQPPRTFFWERKPMEELYDLIEDPDEVRNLAGSSQHRTVLEELRRAQRDHLLQTRDVGLLPEPEIHSRSAGSTPYEMGHNPKLYPLEKILAMAETASAQERSSRSKLKKGLIDGDSAVRYWAVLGFLMQGKEAVRQVLPSLEKALADSSPSVRIAAAQTLALHGESGHLPTALKVLGDLAPADRNGVYVSTMALNAIDALGTNAAPLAPLIRSVSVQDPHNPRPGECAARLTESILRTLGEAPRK
jgi:arylsulfatase A-like enzyme